MDGLFLISRAFVTSPRSGRGVVISVAREMPCMCWISYEKKKENHMEEFIYLSVFYKAT